MNINAFLKLGNLIVGSALDGKVKPVSEMTFAMQRRHGYVEPDGTWTDKGYDRATTADYKALDTWDKAVKQAIRKIK